MRNIRKVLYVFFVFLFAVAFCGCKAKDEDVQVYFNAAVLEISENIFRVRPLEGEDELNSADEITFEIKSIEQHLPDVRVGDRIRIAYNGEILESYPAMLSKVYAVYLLDNTGRAIN